MKPMSLLPKTRWPLATLGALLLLALAGPAARAADASATPVLPVASGSQDFLPPEVAFRVAARVEAPDRVRLSWAIAPGYYLYKSRLKFATSSPVCKRREYGPSHACECSTRQSCNLRS